MSLADLAAQMQRDSRASPVLERCDDDVLWTIAPPGIVLHNFRRRIFMELDALGYSLWAFLDGGRSADDAVQLATAHSGIAEPERAFALIRLLQEQGFVKERRS